MLLGTVLAASSFIPSQLSFHTCRHSKNQPALSKHHWTDGALTPLLCLLLALCPESLGDSVCYLPVCHLEAWLERIPSSISRYQRGAKELKDKYSPFHP